MATVAAVLIATVDPETAALGSSLQAEGFVPGVVTKASEAREVREKSPQCVAIIDGDLPPAVAFEIYKVVRGGSQAVPTLLLVSPEAYQRFALDPHQGPLEEYVSKPVSVAELALRLKAVMLRAGYELPQVEPKQGPPSSRTEADYIRSGQVVTVFSVKGGSGKSTIALNLAIGLAQLRGRKTLLVDADLWFGDVGVLLNTFSEKSIFNVCAGSEPDLFSLTKAIVQHPSGLSVLLRPSDPVVVERLDRACLVKAVRAYTALFDFVIVDTNSSLDEVNLHMMDTADRILLIVTPEMSAIHNTTRFLGVADALDFKRKLSLVLNRANSGINVRELEESLGMTVSRQVVSAGRLVVEAANEGCSVFAKDRPMKEQISRDLAGVVNEVVGEERNGTDKPRRWWAPIFRKQA